jgi:hypothetical protein
MQESWRTRARVPIRPRDDDRRFHQASGAWKTENGDGHAKWWLSEPVELVYSEGLTPARPRACDAASRDVRGGLE